MISIIEPQDNRPYATIASKNNAPISSIPEALFVDLYKKHGAIILRDFGVDLEGFKAFTSQYCAGSVFNESPDRVVIDKESNIQSVNSDTTAFPLHPELSREPWKPDICFFWCINPPTLGGETTICDGVEIVSNLLKETVDLLKQRRLLYRRVVTQEVLEYWLGTSAPSDSQLATPPERCPFQFKRMPSGHVIRYFTRPALHKPMFTDELAFGNFILFARYLLNKPGLPVFENGDIISDDLVHEIKTVSDRLTAPLDWRAGDIAILDNSRFMHGRNEIIDTQEREIATFFGFLKFAAEYDEEASDPFWRATRFVPPK